MSLQDLNPPSFSEVKAALHDHASAPDAEHLKRFFKTGPGEYGEGDIFIGIRVPVIRRLAKNYANLSLVETLNFLISPVHEERLFAVILLVQRYKAGDEEQQKEIYEIYLAHTAHINNWDLVDLSAEHIVGAYLFTRSREPLSQLAVSRSLWERRIAIIATFFFIRKNDFDETLQIAKQLVEDREDLIHKAVGWMLREVGKRDRTREESFLREFYQTMPRTMLRYAIERFPEPLRQQYLKGEIAY